VANTVIVVAVAVVVVVRPRSARYQGTLVMWLIQIQGCPRYDTVVVVTIIMKILTLTAKILYFYLVYRPVQKEGLMKVTVRLHSATLTIHTLISELEIPEGHTLTLYVIINIIIIIIIIIKKLCLTGKSD
jgi:hypothetical protein